MPFRDRREAGRQLAERLLAEQFRSPIVLALPRGGVPVGAEVAAALVAPLDLVVARKIGAPRHEEFGIGAVAEGLDAPVLTVDAGGVGADVDGLQAMVERAFADVANRVQRYRGGRRPIPALIDHDVIVVDDGLATGVTAEAALRAVVRRAPRRVVFAVPVCAPESAERLVDLADEVVYLTAPARLGAVGSWYDDFSQTTDEEVLRLLEEARRRESAR